jgi:signal transduction histidine kinase
MRLTLLYAGMFLLSGTVVLAIVYLLSASSSAITVSPVPGSEVVRAYPVSPSSSGPGPGKLAVPEVPAAPKVPAIRVTPAKGLVDRQHSADNGRLLEVSWLALAVTTLASALFGWIAAGRVLRPLRTITTTAQTISARNLHERLALAGPDDEFKQLGDTLDDLLGRLEASFEAQRRFVANASHELRTPLTLDRTLLQVALADPEATIDTLRSTCEELVASGKEQEHLLEALLTLASSERGLDHREPVDLFVLAARVISTARAEIELRGLRVETAFAPATTSGDPALLERLIANLTDNATRYNDPGGVVTVSTETRSGHAVLAVTNTGPVVPADELDRLFEPFQRLDAARAMPGDAGHGLGLSIVRAIAAAHDATVTAQPQPGGGLVVTVTFPPADAPQA